MDRKTIALKIGIIILFCAGIFFIYITAKKMESRLFSNEKKEIDEINNSNNVDRVNYQGEWYIRNTKIETLLFIGIDQIKQQNASKNKETGSQQADFLMLLVMDKENEAYQAIMINRDTMTDIKTIGPMGDYIGTETAQIALSHAYGNDEAQRNINTRWAIENLFYDISVNEYISFTMDAVPILNDLVGGVPVKIEDDFSNVDGTLIKGGTITLKGDQSLHFIRARKGMPEATNINRMERQKQYLDSFLKYAKKSAEDDTKFYLNALDAVDDYLSMNCSTQDIVNLDNVLRNYSYNGITELSGESKKGEKYMEFYVDDQALQEIVMELFYEKE